jgi:organic radical activating enzyme
MESIYWVVSRDCNQRCPHCYNDSEPGAPGLTLEQADRCVNHLPEPGDVLLDRIILSGGEVLVWPELLFHTLTQLYDRYRDATKLMVQTNGDLLDEALLDRLLAHHVCRLDVSSIDKYHPKSTLRRREYLERLFTARGMAEANTIARGQDEAPPAQRPLVYAFWGATEDQWIGPLWPRGRARQNQLSRAGPDHNFCGDWSGAKNFLNYRGTGCEVNVQLADVYPCCPMTCRPLGSLLAEPLLTMLDRCAQHPVYRALNEGRPEAMGEHLGIGEQEGFRRSRELGNHCLWCDEFFTKHAPDLLYHGGMTERGTVDLTIRFARSGVTD